MKPFAAAALALCSWVAMLAPEFALAEPRDIAGPPEPQTPEMVEARREQMAHDMAEWLPRLVGRYRLEGLEQMFINRLNVPLPPPVAVRGKADCVPVGSGPGVQCVIRVEWELLPSRWSGAWLSSDSPTVILYGIDPVAARIRYLQVDHRSIAQQGEAVLTGNTLHFHDHFVNQRRPNPREQRFQITATARDAPLKLSADYELNEIFSWRVDMTLERESQDAVD